MKTIILISLALTSVLFSFSKPGKSVSTLKEMKKVLKDGYCYIPQGATIVDGDTTECSGFFMMKGEVTNFNYKEYLFSLKSAGLHDEYRAALPDTAKWNMKNGYNTKMAEYYFSHPAYRDYPVVNVSREQAENYCKWLTQIWQKKTGNSGLEFRLPKRSEFLRAANGTDIRRPYAWKGPFFTRNDGRYQCNSIVLGAGAISRDTVNGGYKVVTDAVWDYALADDLNYSNITAPSISFWPNEFGVYNLNGNVAEMISEGNFAVGGSWNSPGYDVRNESIINFTESSPMVGFRPVMTFVEKSR